MLWRYLEGEGRFALRLSPDDDDAHDAHEAQQDAGHHHGGVAGQQRWETVGQEDAQDGDEER